MFEVVQISYCRHCICNTVYVVLDEQFMEFGGGIILTLCEFYFIP